jgi:hypothetical protein
VEANRQWFLVLDGGGSLNFIVMVGEALRTMPGGGNNCGEHGSVLGAPFIRLVGKVLRTTPGDGNNCGEDGRVLGVPFIHSWWSEAPHRGMQSAASTRSSVRFGSS